MLIVPYVCAEFVDDKGDVLYRIKPEMLRTMQEAPESIANTLLFKMLVNDGSIKTPETAAQKKLLEQDPTLGMGADGKEVKEEAPAEEAAAEPKTRNSKAKTASK